MTQSETQERLKQIRERRNALQLRHGDWPCQTVHNSRERAFQQYILADIDFLLSLIDSQATGGITVSTLVGYEAGLKDGKDEMRTACVEKVKEIAARYKREQFAEAGNQRIVEKTRLDTANAIAVELSSLTLDQVQQKEQSK